MDEFPDWMIGDSMTKFVEHELALPRGNRQALINLEKQDFEIAFETVLEDLASGRTMAAFCREYHRPISPNRFRTWIFQNPKRKEAYLVAKAIGAEAVEDDLIRIADGLNPDGSPAIGDVGRSRLQIDTRKWVLGVWNRKRYGDVKHIEQTSTVTTDISSLTTEQLRAKVIDSLGLGSDVYDGTFEEVGDDDGD